MPEEKELPWYVKKSLDAANENKAKERKFTGKEINWQNRGWKVATEKQENVTGYNAAMFKMSEKYPAEELALGDVIIAIGCNGCGVWREATLKEKESREWSKRCPECGKTKCSMIIRGRDRETRKVYQKYWRKKKRMGESCSLDKGSPEERSYLLAMPSPEKVKLAEEMSNPHVIISRKGMGLSDLCEKFNLAMKDAFDSDDAKIKIMALDAYGRFLKNFGWGKDHKEASSGEDGEEEKISIMKQVDEKINKLSDKDKAVLMAESYDELVGGKDGR